MVSGSKGPRTRPTGTRTRTSTGQPGAHRARRRAHTGLFTRSAIDYAEHRPGQVIAVVQCGCATAGDLDLAALRAGRHQVALTMMDDDNQVTRAAVAARPELGNAVLADLRTVPLAPRTVDIVHCSLLVNRISHVELVLGRLVDALRPGGLLLLRTTDRQSAAGFLDRMLPGPLRALAWRSLHPGEPGPYPAVYEELTSARGINAFVTRRGLVISGRETTSRLEGRRLPVVGACRAIVAGLSRGRLTAGHDELGYVIRKPEDRFARVL